MEEAGQDYGYILYKTNMPAAASSLKIEDANDRINGFVNQKPVFTAFDKEINSAQKISAAAGDELSLLVENLGRVNFAGKIPFQRKGIFGKVSADGTALENWKYFNLNLDAKQLSKIDWSKASPARDTAATSATDSTPTFTRFHFEVDEACDTYLDFAGWGKGCIFLNGFNLGRFWEIGPQKRLYVPAPLLRTGTNEVIIFETEGKTNSSIEFFAEHKLF